MPRFSFDAPEHVARYLREGPTAFLPGHGGLMRMIGVLVAERAPLDAHLLIVGAGGGLETRHLATAGKDWTFAGLDPSPAMLDLARATAGVAAGDRLRLIEGVAADAPEGPFDAATCILVLGLIPDDGAKATTLAEVRRRLKPGAPFILVDQCIDPGAPDRELRLDRYAAYTLASGVDPQTVQHAREAISQSDTVVAPGRNEYLLELAGFSGTELFYLAMSWRGWLAYA